MNVYETCKWGKNLNETIVLYSFDSADKKMFLKDIFRLNLKQNENYKKLLLTIF